MKVKAKKLLYYGDRRIRPGQEFELVHRAGVDRFGNKIELTPEQQFSEKSMEALEPIQKAETPRKPAPKPLEKK